MIEVIVMICAVIFIAIVINGVEDYFKSTNKMSFREAMDLAELPVVTFYQDKEKFNFLLDTGSTHSHISSEVVNRLKGTPTENLENIQGVGGEVTSNTAIKATLEYKSKTYEVLLVVGEHLNAVFKSIKGSTGVQLHGIIGSNFLSDNRYILDFDEFIAYQKK